MKDLELFGGVKDFPEKTMTIKEVAEILNVSDRTVSRHSYDMGLTKNGKTTYLNETQVTEIKLKIERSGRNDLDNVGKLPKTDLEKELLIQQAMQFQAEKIQSMQLEISVLKPKAALAEAALRDDSKHYSIRDAGKHLGLNQTEIFAILRNKSMLTSKNLPSQNAIDCNILTLRTNVVGTKNRPQSIMTMQNIDNFRKRYL